MIKSSVFYDCHTEWDYDGNKAVATRKFANAFISTTCVLNDRKVMKWILQRLKMMKI